MKPILILALIPALILLMSGCALRGHAGYVHSVDSSDGDIPSTESAGEAALISAHVDLIGVYGGSMRSKIGPDLFSIASGFEVGLPAMPETFGPISPSLYAGFQLLQYDRTFQRNSFGMGSPYLQPGINLCDLKRIRRAPDQIRCLTLAGEWEYHIRFGQPNEQFLGLSIGIVDRRMSLD